MIVELETGALMPQKMIGEIWISSATMFPSELWSLKKLSDKLLKAKAHVYTYTDDKFTRQTYPGYKFIRTGYVGFTIPKSRGSEVYVLGTTQDILQQAHYASDNMYFLDVSWTRWSHAFSFNFTPMIIQSIIDIIPDILAWYIVKYNMNLL